MSNSTRQNNKRADRKMESNDISEIPDRGETSEEPGLPFGSKEWKSSKEDFESIKYIDKRTRRREIRQKKRNRLIRTRLLQQAMVVEGLFSARHPVGKMHQCK